MQKDVYILAIESSCDETSAAVVKNGRYSLSNIISSQIDIHVRYGGVVPEIASRKHIENISAVVDEALSKSGLTMDAIDAIAVTYGPGLVGALLVGVSYAKALAFATKKPLVGVHHIEGHICSNFIEDKNLQPPFIALVVSGGHTHLVRMEDYGKYEILGHTRDDAAGEAYDKVARVLGLPYPGGPKIDELAKLGDEQAVIFPKALMEGGSLDFSFSGLKSAVLNYINKCKMTGVEINKADLAASFQKAVVDVLVQKTMNACEAHNSSKLVMAGGVACNSALRAAMTEMCNRRGYTLTIPSPVLCTDNAAMIASAGYFEYIRGVRHDLTLNAYPGLQLGEKV